MLMKKRPMKRPLFCLTLLLLSFVVLPFEALSQGAPLSHDFTYRDYRAHPLVWDYATDAQGLIYLANNDGVLVYDGARWMTVPTDNSVRALAIGHNGEVLVGTMGGFGWLAPNNAGQLEYRSLADKLKLKNGEVVRNVSQIFVSEKTTYWLSNDAVITMTGTPANANLQRNVVDSLRGGALIGRQLLVNIDGKGLHKFEAGTVSALTGGEQLDRDVLAGGLAMGTTAVVGGANDGLFSIKGGEVQAFSTPAADYLYAHGIIAIRSISRGRALIGTYSGGALILSADGAIEQKLTAAQGLPSNDIYSVFEDTNGEIWIGHSKGVTVFTPNLHR